MSTKSFQTQKLYLNWANSVLCEVGLEARTIEDLGKGEILGALVDTLWPAAKLKTKIKESSDQSPEGVLTVLLEYLEVAGAKHSINPKAILDGELKSILELLWVLILNFSIHTPKLSAFQRNIKVGKRNVLNWCRVLLPQLTVNHTETLVNNVVKQDCALIDLISTQCAVKYDADTLVYLTHCLEAVQEQYSISKEILNPEAVLSGSVSEEALLIYLTLLRRKVKLKDDSSNGRELRASAGAARPKLGMSSQAQPVPGDHPSQQVSDPGLGQLTPRDLTPGEQFKQPGPCNSAKAIMDIDGEQPSHTEDSSSVTGPTSQNSKPDNDTATKLNLAEINVSECGENQSSTCQAEKICGDNNSDSGLISEVLPSDAFTISDSTLTKGGDEELAFKDDNIDSEMSANNQNSAPPDDFLFDSLKAKPIGADLHTSDSHDKTSDIDTTSSQVENTVNIPILDEFVSKDVISCAPGQEELSSQLAATGSQTSDSVDADLTVTGKAIEEILDNQGTSSVSSEATSKNGLNLKEELEKAVEESGSSGTKSVESETDSVNEVREHMAELLDNIDSVEGSTLGSTGKFEGGLFRVSSCSCSNGENSSDLSPGNSIKNEIPSDTGAMMYSNPSERGGIDHVTEDPCENGDDFRGHEDININPCFTFEETIGEGNQSEGTNIVQTLIEDDDTSTGQETVSENTLGTTHTSHNGDSVMARDELSVDVDSELSYEDSEEEKQSSEKNNNKSSENHVLGEGDADHISQHEVIELSQKLGNMGTVNPSDLKLNLGDLGASMESEDMDWNADLLNSLISTGIEDIFEQSGFSRSDAKDVLGQSAVQEAVRSTIQEQLALYSARKSETSKSNHLDQIHEVDGQHLNSDNIENDDAKREDCNQGPDPTEESVSIDRPDVASDKSESQPSDNSVSHLERDGSKVFAQAEPPNDELLHILDNIGQRGECIQSELELAQVRESILKEEIELDDKCITHVHETLSIELDNVAAEKKTLLKQFDTVSKEAHEHKDKSDKLEALVDRMQGHIDELSGQIAEANYREQVRKQGLRNISITTELPFTYNIGLQAECVPLTYDQGVQVRQPVTSVACQCEESNASQGVSSIQSEVLHIAHESSLTPIQSPRSQDSTKVPRSPSRATAMIDKILKQMSNIAESGDRKDSASSSSSQSDTAEESLKGLEKEPEGPGKWRELAMAHLNSRPEVLALQKSLASATLEYDLVCSKLTKANKESSRRFEELNKEVEQAQMSLLKAKEENEILQVRREGDQSEMDILKDKIANMERTLSVAQIENDKLETKLKETLPSLKSNLSDSADEATAVGEQYKKLKNQLLEIEIDREKMNKNFESLKKDHEQSVENRNDLESSLADVSSEKRLLEAEVLVLRDEYTYLKKGMEVMEKFFKLKVLETEKTQSQREADTVRFDIDELKKHVFGETQTVSGFAGNSCQSTSTFSNKPKAKGDSLHENIMTQSELVLQKLLDSSEGKSAQPPETIVHWTDVRNSIAEKLVSETKENIEPKTDISGKKAVQSTDNQKLSSDSSNSNSGASCDLPAIDSAVIDSLVSEIKKNIGAQVQLSSNPSDPNSLTLQLENSQEGLEGFFAKDSDIALPDSIKLDLRKINKQKMEEAYEELRKRRLAMLVQAYTGRNDAENLMSKIKTAQSQVDDVTRPPVSSSAIVTEAMTGQKKGSTVLSAADKMEAQMIADTKVLAEESKRIKDKLLAMKDSLGSQRDEFVSLPNPYGSSEVPRVTTRRNKDDAYQRSKDTPPKSSRYRDSLEDREDYPPGPNIRLKLFSGPKRQIWPHKKGYESSSSFHRKRQEIELDKSDPYEDEYIADWSSRSKARPLSANQSLNQSYDHYSKGYEQDIITDPRLSQSMLDSEAEDGKRPNNAFQRFRMARKSKAPKVNTREENDSEYDENWEEDWEEEGQTYLEYVREKYRLNKSCEPEKHTLDLEQPSPTPNKFQRFIAKHKGKAIRKEVMDRRQADSTGHDRSTLSMNDLNTALGRKYTSDVSRKAGSSTSEDAYSGKSRKASSTDPAHGTLPSSDTLRYPIEEKTRKFLSESSHDRESHHYKSSHNLERPFEHFSLSSRTGSSAHRDLSPTGEYPNLPSFPRTVTAPSLDRGRKQTEVENMHTKSKYESHKRERSPYSSFTDYTKRDPSIHIDDHKHHGSGASKSLLDETRERLPSPFHGSPHSDQSGLTRPVSRSSRDPEERVSIVTNTYKSNIEDRTETQRVRFHPDEDKSVDFKPYKSYISEPSRSTSGHVASNTESSSTSNYRSLAHESRGNQDKSDEISHSISHRDFDIPASRSAQNKEPELSISAKSHRDSHATYLAYITGDYETDKNDNDDQRRLADASYKQEKEADDAHNRKYLLAHSSQAADSHTNQDRSNDEGHYESARSTQQEVRNIPENKYDTQNYHYSKDNDYHRDMEETHKSTAEGATMSRKLSRDGSETESVSEVDFVVTRGGDIVARRSPKPYSSSSGSKKNSSKEVHSSASTDANDKSYSKQSDRKHYISDSSNIAAKNYDGDSSSDKRYDTHWVEPRLHKYQEEDGRDTPYWKEPKRFMESQSTGVGSAKESGYLSNKSLQDLDIQAPSREPIPAVALLSKVSRAEAQEPKEAEKQPIPNKDEPIIDTTPEEKQVALSEEQRKYADSIIAKYAEEWEKNQQNKQSSDPLNGAEERTAPKEFKTQEPQIDVSEILHRYSQQPSEQNPATEALMNNGKDSSGNTCKNNLSALGMQGEKEGELNLQVPVEDSAVDRPPEVSVSSINSQEVNDIIEKYNQQYQNKKKHEENNLQENEQAKVFTSSGVTESLVEVSEVLDPTINSLNGMNHGESATVE